MDMNNSGLNSDNELKNTGFGGVERSRGLLVFTIIALVAIVAFAVIRIYIIKNNYEPGTLYYEGDYLVKSGTASNVFTWAVIGFSVLLLIVSSVFSRRVVNSLNIYSVSAMFGSSFSGMSLFALSGVFAYQLISDHFTLFESRTVFYVFLGLLILTAAYMVFSATSSFNPESSACILISLIPVACVGAKAVMTFFATTDKQIWNSTFFQLSGIVVLLLFFINESRFVVGKGSSVFYMFFGWMSVFLLTVYAVPDIILSLFWELDPESLVDSAVDLVFAVYVLFRLFALRTFVNVPDFFADEEGDENDELVISFLNNTRKDDDE